METDIIVFKIPANLDRILGVPLYIHSCWPQSKLWPHLTFGEVPESAVSIITHTGKEGGVTRMVTKVIHATKVTQKHLE